VTAVSSLADSLRGGLNPALWTYNGNTTFTGAGVTVASPAGTDVYGGLDSAVNWSLARSAMYVRLVDAGNQSLASWQVFINASASSGGVQWMLQGGTLAAQSSTGSGYTDAATITYSATAMRWLRIREASGTVYWDYSADGVTWTTLASAADPVALTSVQVQIGSGTYADEASSTSSTWADFSTQFPQAPLDLRTELDLSADGWTDATDYPMQREGTSPPVTLQRGRQDESTQATASSASFELNNRDGRFSPLNPTGPYYGQLSKNTPVRFSVPAASNYLNLENDGDLEFDGQAFTQCASSSALGATSALDFRVDLNLSDDRESIIASKWNSYSDGAWALWINGSGMPCFASQAPAGTWYLKTGTVPVPPGRSVLRVTWTGNDGSGNHVTTFYAGTSLTGSAWTELGTPVPVAGTLTMATTTAPLILGFNGSFSPPDLTTGQLPRGAIGQFFGAAFYVNGGSTAAADPDFTAVPAGTGNVTDSAGNAWEMFSGALVDDRDYRYHGEMSAMPTRWDVTGRDISVPVTAGGPLRRLTQQNSPVASPLKRGILSQQGTLFPVAYWPMEDGQDATQLGSATGGTALSITDGTPNLATSTVFNCSNAIPEMNGCQFAAYLPPVTSTNTVIMRALVCPGSTATTQSPWPLLSVFTSGLGRCDILFYADQLGLGMQTQSGYSSGEINFGADAPGGTLASQPMWMSLELQQSGSTVNISLIVLFPGDPYTNTAGFETTGSFTGTVGAPQQVLVHGGSMTDTAVGHLQVQTEWTSMFNLGGPFGAWAGETAAARFARLAAENGFAARITGAPSASAIMGPQAVDTLQNLLQASEDADRGQVYEPRQVYALGYRTRASMYAQAAAVTADYSQSHPGGTQGGTEAEIEPTFDDLLTMNDMTLTRSSGNVSGGTYQYQLDDGSPMSVTAPPAGAGDYANSLSVAVDADSQLPDIAAWMVHVGTDPGYRWPVIPFNLARAAVADIAADLADADIGDLAVISNLPDAVTSDPERQLIWQVTEALGGFHRTVTYTGVPGTPYDVAVAGTAVADSGASTLHAAVSATATSLSVAVASGPLWTTSVTPFDVTVAGETMTVTAITGSSSPQAFTVTRSVNGVAKAQAAGAPVAVTPSPVMAL
jgi:hypothetical protein